MHPAPPFTVEKMQDYRGHRDRCGQGPWTDLDFLYSGKEPVGSYELNFTVEHLYDFGKKIDLTLGKWGDEHGHKARSGVTTVVRIIEEV